MSLDNLINNIITVDVFVTTSLRVVVSLWSIYGIKKEEIELSPMTKAQTKKILSNATRQTPPTHLIKQRLRTDLGRSVVVSTATQTEVSNKVSNVSFILYDRSRQ